MEAEQQAALAAAAGGVASGVGAGPSQAMTVAGGGSQLNANLANAANSAKKDPNIVPYRYCMPTHSVYTPPVPTARNNNSLNQRTNQNLNQNLNFNFSNNIKTVIWQQTDIWKAKYLWFSKGGQMTVWCWLSLFLNQLNSWWKQIYLK